MSNSVVEDFKNKEDQKNAETNDNISKRYFPVRNTIKLVLLLLTLGVLAPTPVQAKSSHSKPHTATYSFLQDKPQSKTKYSEEEIERGVERVKNLIKYHKQDYKDDGKTEKTMREKLESDYIIDLFSHLDYNSYGKFAEKLEVILKKVSQFEIIFVNGEFFDFSTNNKSYTKELLQGYENIVVGIHYLNSDKTNDGILKTKEQSKYDNFAAEILKDCLISDKDFDFIYTGVNDYKENLTSSQKEENNKRLKKIACNLQLLAFVANKKGEISKYYENEIDTFSVNDFLYLSDENNGKCIKRFNNNPMYYFNGKSKTDKNAKPVKEILFTVEGGILKVKAGKASTPSAQTVSTATQASSLTEQQ